MQKNEEFKWLMPPYRYPIPKSCPICGSVDNLEIRNALLEGEGLCFDGFACKSCGRLIKYDKNLEQEITIEEEIERTKERITAALDIERDKNTKTLREALRNIADRTGEYWTLVNHIVRQIIGK